MEPILIDSSKYVEAALFFGWVDSLDRFDDPIKTVRETQAVHFIWAKLGTGT